MKSASTMPVSTRASGLAWGCGLPQIVPAAFLFFALPAIVFLVFNVPLFQSPDEHAHFLRALQVAGGEVVGRRQGDGSGGSIDPSALTLMASFIHLPFDSNARLTRDKVTAAQGLSWSGKRTFADFRGTVIYPPFLYAPAIIGIVVGKAVGLSPYRTTLLARLMNGLAAAMIGFLALRVCRRGQLLMFTVLLLPMSLSLFASCSQDALIITVSCLAIAFVSRVVMEHRDATPHEAVTIALLVAFVCMARPPYIPLAGLLMIPTIYAGRSSSKVPVRVAVFATVLGSTAAWLAVAAGVHVPIARPGVVSAPGDQLTYLMQDPSVVWSIAVHTFNHYGAAYAKSFVGVLGWLDTPFPEGYYRLAYFVLGFAVIGDIGQRESWSGRAVVVSAGILLLCALFVFGALYLTWTQVGAGIIEGVQGRYFLALAPLLAFALPRLPLQPRIRSGLSVVVLCFPWITMINLPRVIIERYYLM